MIKVPFFSYFSIPDIPITATTQSHVPVADITNDIVIYKDGGAALILESTSLNFGLLSEKEQAAVIAAYAAMINSLSFSIQIVVTSQRKDIKNYLNFLAEQKKKVTKPLLLHLMESYESFITESVKKKAKIILYPRRDHLMRQAGRVGIKLRQLGTPEIIDYVYKAYNPEKPAVK